MNIKELKESGRTTSNKKLSTDDHLSNLIIIKQAGFTVCKSDFEQAKIDSKLYPDQDNFYPYPSYFISDGIVYSEC